MRLALRAALVLALVSFLPGLLEGWESPKAAVVRVAGLGLLAAALVRPATLRGLRLQRLDVAIAAWLLVEGLATALSIAPRLSLFGDPQQHEGLLTSLGLAGCYLAGRLTLRTPEDARGLRTAWFVGAGVASGYALLQIVGLDPAPWIHTATLGNFVRPFGTMGHPNLLGVVTCGVGAAAVALALEPGRGWIRVGLALLFAATTLITFSRAAWLGLAAGAVVAVLLSARARGRAGLPRGALLAGAALLLVGVALVALTPLREPLMARLHDLIAPGEGSGRSRLDIWRAALAAWRERPWLGQGPDTFALTFTRLQPPEYWRLEWNHVAWHGHSILLHTLATRGLLGAAAGVLVAAGAVVAALRAWRAGGGVRTSLIPPLSAVLATVIAGTTGALGIAGALILMLLLARIANLAPSPPAAAAAPVAEPSRRRERKRPVMTRRDPVPAVVGVAVALGVAAFSMLDLGNLASAGLARRWIDGAQARMASAAVWDRIAAQVETSAARAPWDDAAPRTLAELELARSGGDPSSHPWLDRAERAARLAARRVPLRAANHRRLADALLLQIALGDSARAEECRAEFARAAALAPHDAFLLKEWIRADVMLGHPHDALATAQRLTELYPERGMAQEVLGEARLANGDRAGARAAFARSLQGAWEEDLGARTRARHMLDTLATGAP